MLKLRVSELQSYNLHSPIHLQLTARTTQVATQQAGCLWTSITRTKAYVWHPTGARCYLSCNLLTTAWGVAVSTCMGDGGPTWGHAAVMDIGSISGLGAGKGAAIMGTTAYWWYWRDSCCTAANCDINQNNYIGTNNSNAVRCHPALMVTWLQSGSLLSV